ncbi:MULTISPECIES: DUF6056 family protein [Citrobacter]|uniref:DUF6056 family protein n=1 Tax=Citrobacter TaxID=544 RepID=UPI00061B398E|nr:MULTISPECIES: DUF6056 family protein [Citrobacter]KKC63184.1 hypothetical protein WG82_13385 [Citrobacter amalonaticus]MBJ8995424.1 hypothetical protein [Citrobacter braakii]MDM3454096.1 DUF6056 family protein [Citrobacter sp. Cb028]
MHSIKQRTSQVFIASLAICFALTFLVALKTPMHSDDYLYALKGLSFESHYQHYIKWSGRVISDYISPALLLMPHWLRAAFNSLALVFLIGAIVIFGKQDKDIDTKDALSVLLITSLYYISNSNLGQTTFWIVGSANYLWTNMFIVCFFLCVKRKINVLATSFFAFLAGCSNENTSIVVVILIATYLAYQFIKKDVDYKKTILYLLLNIFGCLLLLLSPGNMERAKFFEAWYSKPLVERLFEHVTYRIPAMAEHFWALFLAVAVISTLYTLKHNHDKGGINTNSALSLIFVVSAIISMLIMFAAPSYPPRSGNGTLILFMISLSLILGQTTNSNNKNIIIYGIILIILSTLPLFIPAYYLMHKEYSNAFDQDKVRMSLIERLKNEGKRDFKIPNFFFGTLSSDSYKFDLYHNKWSYGAFFGVNSIEGGYSNFDYSSILNSKEIDVDKELIPKQAILKKIFISEKGYLVFITNRNMSLPDNGKEKLFIHAYYNNKSGFKNYDCYPKSMMIDKDFVTGIKMDTTNLDYIQVGVFSGTTRKTDLKIYVN